MNRVDEVAAASEGVLEADPAAGVATPRRGGSAGAWVRLLRPHQWVKNTFVLAPLFFSGEVTNPARVLDAILAFVLFSLLASGVYCWNDAVDREADRAHPLKRLRPVAAGEISPRKAVAVGLTLVTVAVLGGWWLDPFLGIVSLSYVGLNVVYNAVLKSLVLLDVFAIAAFFVLRLLAGVAAIDVHPSVWLLLCGGLLALYLGFAKRRHELSLVESDPTLHRSVLEHYDTGLLDQLAVILLSVTVVSYIMYTLTSETALEVGAERLAYSTVFVLYGVFRYLYLVHGRGKGGDPTDTLLTDPALLTTVALWLAYCSWTIYFPG